MSNGTVHGSGRAQRITPSSDLGEAAAALGSQITRFTRLIAAWKQRAKYDGGAADRVLLARLVMGGDRRATDLAADAFLDLSTVSRQVRSLVERGLVARHRDPEDRRGSLLSATEEGRAAFEQYRRERDTKLADLLQEWPAEDRAELIRLMSRLNDDLAEERHSRPTPGGDQGQAEHGDTPA
ncbi:MarR family winged helix-turn-helix transcriptional regulator [Streptomyces sp. NPDC059740]|uniref:MarR family winged helix-turn-helix transcriptional regulator n=1 Tax=Streptomyces sp. NPDC059740 TaxID=3346926 RepID=UPI0036488690